MDSLLWRKAVPAKNVVKVLHLITELNSGGAEQLLATSMQQKWPAHYRHSVVTLYDGDTALAESIRQVGIPVVDLAMKRNGRIRGLWQFYRLLRQERPHIIHSWLIHAALLGRVMGRLTGVPIIVTARHSVDFGSGLRQRLNRWTSHLDDRTIAICDHMRQVEMAQTGVATEKIVTIFNGIPNVTFPERQSARTALLQSLRLPPDALLVGTVGRLHAAKGHADLAEAVPQIVTAMPQVHFVWIGDGPERTALEAQVKRLEIAGHVHFLGDRTDVPALLVALDLFVMPSRWEGLSVGILEAMAAGLPVVATAVGGSPELVIDGEAGRLVPPQDAAVLAQAIRQILINPVLARQMGAAGRQRVQSHFTIEQMVRQTEQLYDALLQMKGLRD